MPFAKYDAKKVTKEELVAVGTERTRYFDGIGANVAKATSLDAALQLSGLNFEVAKAPMLFTTKEPQTLANGAQIEIAVPHEVKDQFVTYRTDTMQPFAPVGKNYVIYQNNEAFNFLDSLIVDGEAKFDTAGSYGKNGSKNFITMLTEPMNILDDQFQPYILFMNSFDGSGSIRVMFTPIRVFCSNCLIRANKESSNKVCIRHSNSLKSQMEAAKEVLLMNSKYLEYLKKESERLAVIPYSKEQFEAYVNNHFFTKDNDSATVKARNDYMITSLMKAYNQDDLQNFNGTAWKAVQAFADFESHKPSFRNTDTIKYKNIEAVTAEMPLTNAVMDMFVAA